jgi:hypothetical protein
MLSIFDAMNDALLTGYQTCQAGIDTIFQMIHDL